MKFFRILIVSLVFASAFQSCKKETENLWNVEIDKPIQKINLVDISKEFYDPNVPLESFQQKYPWFQGTVSNEDFGKRRNDQEEAKIYKDAIAKIDMAKLDQDLKQLFSHIQHHIPKFQTPTVFLYSSALQGVTDPIFYKPEENFLFIDVSAFMGENNENYKPLEQYYQKSMNPQNIIPKVSLIFAEHFVPFNAEHQKFIDQLVYQGKLMILQDAFIPKQPDYLKMNYTAPQYEWAKTNEANIWNYIVENDLVFSDDAKLVERFIAPGPFSKFYTEIDNESSPQIGIFIGWQIAKKYFQENPETPLKEFLQLDAQKIFTDSKYNPKFEN